MRSGEPELTVVTFPMNSQNGFPMADQANGGRAAFSVIVPTYNRATVLLKCLEALDRQTVPKDAFEVLVVDDGCEDETTAVVRQFAASHTLNLRYIRQENGGQNAARNRAIGCCRGRILLFINDDTIATPEMIEGHMISHRAYPEEHIAVLGRVTISPDLPPSLFATLHLDSAYALWENAVELPWKAFYTCNVSLKKNFLLKYGLFDEDLRYNDDLELAERLSHHGFRIIYNKRSLGYHYHYLTEDDYLRLARLSGKTLAVWYRKSPHLKRELSTIGFYKGSSFTKRVEYFLADVAINEVTRPLVISVARHISGSHEDVARLFYRKIYKSIERQSIRRALRGTFAR